MKMFSTGAVEIRFRRAGCVETVSDKGKRRKFRLYSFCCMSTMRVSINLEFRFY